MVITALEKLPKRKLQLNFVKNCLLEEESKGLSKKGGPRSRVEINPATAFTSTKKGPTTTIHHPANRNITAFPFPCHNCGIKGHKRRERRKPGGGKCPGTENYQSRGRFSRTRGASANCTEKTQTGEEVSKSVTKLAD
jgi:hypothetical protein